MDVDDNLTPADEPQKRPTSLMERLTNVIVSPGEVFGELRGAAVDPMNWAVPLVISIVAGIIFSVTVFSQEGVIESMRLAQEAQFDALVEKGEMSESDAERAKGGLANFMNPKFMMLVGVAGVIFATPIGWLILSFLFHWIARLASHSHIPFTKCFEVIGLSSLVSVIGVMVNMLLVVITNNIAMTLSLALAFQEYDPTNRTHALAAEVDLTRIWYIAVLAVAWSRLTHHAVASCGAWLFGIWLTFRISWILLFL